MPIGTKYGCLTVIGGLEEYNEEVVEKKIASLYYSFINIVIKIFSGSGGANALPHRKNLLSLPLLTNSIRTYKFRKKLVAARKETGLTQKELGEKSGLRFRAISPNIRTVLKSLSALEYELDVVKAAR